MNFNVSEPPIGKQRQSLLACFVHIAALNAFSVAQPVFDRLGNNPQFLRLENFSGPAIGTALSLFLLFIPAVTCGIIASLQKLRYPGAAQAIYATVGILLVALSLNIILRWLQWKFGLRQLGVPDVLLLIVSAGSAIGCWWCYRNRDWPGQVLNIAAIGIIFFPLSLLSLPSMQAEVLGIQTTDLSTTAAGNPAPVVMIAFDGLCGMALLNERYEIDAVRYPSFARLAEKSTYYRNATTVHPRTGQAIPAILTGQFPDEEKSSPVESNHPNNLFRLIHKTQQYDMTVFEPLTRLCPTELRQLDQTLTFPQQVQRLTSVLALVYANTSMPSEFESLQPPIPMEWFGLLPTSAGVERPARGLIVYAWDKEHELQINHFIRTLQPSDGSGFHFLHVVLPHDPWSHFPSEKTYLRSTSIDDYPAGSFGTLNELWGSDVLLVNQGWQRYLLQLQYADRCLGRILDKLIETNKFDDSLLVVVADHGMAFVPSVERRLPAAETLPDIMSVPLFIKIPGQNSGSITDENVQTIDVLPTIADVLQLPLPDQIDGRSLIDTKVTEAPRKTMITEDRDMIVVDPKFTQRFNYVDRMIKVFGTGGHDDRLWSLDTIPELCKQPLSNFTHGNPSQWKCRLSHGKAKLSPEYPEFLPCYFQGILVGPKLKSPIQIAIAINGTVQATTRSSTNPANTNQVSALLREEAFSAGSDVVQLFELEGSSDSFVLHEIMID